MVASILDLISASIKPDLWSVFASVIDFSIFFGCFGLDYCQAKLDLNLSVCE